MLPKQHRLPLRTELIKIKREGRLIQGNFFSLLIRIRKNRQPSRFAFIISKKIDKRSSQRNRIRRLLVEAVRNLLPKMEDNFDGVFFAKKTILNKELLEIKNEIEKILLKSD